MYSMDYRQYDPAIARWVVQDPVVHFDYSPYSAFDNNPVFWADPSGADGEHYNWESKRYEDSNGNEITFGQAMSAHGLNDNGGEKKDEKPVNKPHSNLVKKTKTVNKTSNTVAYAGVAAFAIVADDATVVGVVDDVLLPVIGLWAVGALIYDYANTGTETVDYYDYEPAQFNYVTYTKVGSDGKVYVGRSSGYGSPASIVAIRDKNHHMTGYGPAVLSTFAPSTIPGGFASRAIDPAYWSIRGSEQIQINHYRNLNISGNTLNGISPNNPNLQKYMEYAKKVVTRR